MGTSRGTAALAIVISLLGAGSSEAQETLSFSGRLYHSVSDGDMDSPLTNTDRAKIPASLTVRFEKFVRCRAGFRSGLPRPTTFFAEAASAHQRALERALSCLFEGPGIEAAATDTFATRASCMSGRGCRVLPSRKRVTQKHTLQNTRARRSCRICICSRRNDGDMRLSTSRVTATRKGSPAAGLDIVISLVERGKPTL